MDIERLEKDLLAAVEEYLSTPEAWEDAVVTVNTETGAVGLAESEEAETLPDTVDEFDIMDLVEMTPEGKWIPDTENIAAAAAEYR